MTCKQLLRFASLTVLVFGATGLLSAQQNATQNTASGKKTMSITGCVNKGQETGGYFLKDDNGKMWELTDADAKVADHVGHKVTLTGMSTRESKSEEAKKATAEKAEAAEVGGKHSGDFAVSSVKMISESCQ